MTQTQYLDSIAVLDDQLESLIRVLLHQINLLSQPQIVDFELALDPQLKIRHVHIRDVDLSQSIEAQVARVSSKVREANTETFQLLFQIISKTSSLKHSYLKNIFAFKDPQKKIIQEFLLHVTLLSQQISQDASEQVPRARESLKAKLAKILAQSEKTQDLFYLNRNVFTQVIIHKNF